MYNKDSIEADLSKVIIPLSYVLLTVSLFSQRKAYCIVLLFSTNGRITWISFIMRKFIKINPQ
jgi:hypothetical protein